MHTGLSFCHLGKILGTRLLKIKLHHALMHPTLLFYSFVYCINVLCNSFQGVKADFQSSHEALRSSLRVHA